jgi:hypothetical protein
MLAKDFLLFRTSFAVQPFFEGLAQGLPAIAVSLQRMTSNFKMPGTCQVPGIWL